MQTNLITRVVPAPEKNPENIRVEASEPNEMVMKWEVRQTRPSVPQYQKQVLPSSSGF